MRRALQAAAALLLGTGCGTPTRMESQTPFELGREARTAGDYPTAIAQFTIAIDNARDYVFTAALLERGECHLEVARRIEDPAGREQGVLKALRDFDAVLAEPGMLPEERSRALVRKGSASLVRGDPKGAEVGFLQVLELAPHARDLEFRLEAHQQLGWILLERARGARREKRTAQGEIQEQEAFRVAQAHFSRGLEIDRDDAECNLGKGICLHSRKQDREALVYLEKCTALNEAKGRRDHRAHYYLARALEMHKGFQRKALEQYQKAVEQDSARTYTPLYAHLVRVLLDYARFESPQFHWFLDRMLSYAGDDPQYWSMVEALGASLAAAGNGETMVQTGIFARSLARARSGKVEAAVQDALLLKGKAEVLDLLSKIFPVQARRPEYLYGRAMALLGAGRNAELEAFFDEPLFMAPEPSVLESEHYHRALVLKGRNIVARWLEKSRETSAALSTQDKIDREKTLGRARDAFQSYLDRHAEDHEVRMALAEVQELMEAFPTALLSYALIAREKPAQAAAFRRILRLHAEKLLPEKDLSEAWSVLLSYAGDDPDIREYVRRTQVAIQEESLLYCRGCGRKGAQGDRICLECGRRIGRTEKDGAK